ncbi:hypothetical protein [Streptomyces niveus]|uniref:hypothetical protein n=1 Tax=Streptomyces niveus TaxID=193462 RepID=UPI00386769D2
MKTAALKRTFLRTHRFGVTLQVLEQQTKGPARNARSPQGRELIASNMVYRKRCAY